MLSMVLSAVLKFPDVPADYWAYPAITIMASAGVLHGYTNGRFMPNEVLSREQAAAILARIEGLAPKPLPAMADKGRVSPSLAGNVGAAYAAGFIRGTAQGLLEPLGVVTRAEAAAMIARAFQLSMPASAPSTTFRDKASIPAYALAAVTALQETGIVEGTTAGYFLPDSPVTRAEYSAMLLRAIVHAGGAKGLSDVVAGVVKTVLDPNNPALVASSPLGGLAGVIDIGGQLLTLRAGSPVYLSGTQADLYAVAPTDKVAVWLYPGGQAGFIADLGASSSTPDVGTVKNLSATQLYVSTGAVIGGAPVTVQYAGKSIVYPTFPSELLGSLVSVSRTGASVTVLVTQPFVTDLSGTVSSVNPTGLRVQLQSSSAWATLIPQLSAGDTVSIDTTASTVVSGVGSNAPTYPSVGQAVQVIGQYTATGTVQAVTLILSN